VKLLRVVDELQKLRSERKLLRAVAESPVGIAWSHCEKRLDDVELSDGEFLALDVTISGAIGEVPLWRTAERITRDPEDYGQVFDSAGELVGAVRSIKNGLVTLALTGGADAGAAPEAQPERSREAP
jgi:hypothetical protein